MAASLESTLIDPEYRNWVKAGLGLKCTKDGIEHFVDAQVQTFQQKLLTDICQVKGLPAGSVCYICTTQNVLPCPTRGVCTIRRGVCNYHDNHDPSKMNRPCPMGICDEIFDRITKSHRYRSPSWLNTDARDWCRNRWEVAKCYMPPDGYRAVRSAVDTDVTGLLSVIINLKEFQNKVAENLSLQSNVFCQARIIRNDIIHSPTFQLSEAMLNSYIDLMIHLLQDPVRLVTDTKAQDAIAKLKQIKIGSLTVTAEDEKKIREEALRAIDEKKKEAIQDIQDEGSEQMVQIQNRVKTDLQTIQTEGSQQAAQLVVQKKEATEVIKQEASEQMVQIQRAKTELQAIQREAETAITRLVSQEKVSKQTTMDERTVLQRELINLYMENYLKTPVSPLAPDVDVEISKLYVTPCMRQVGPQQNENDPCMNQEKQKVNIMSYKDIFYKDSRQCKKIYITGDAGMGKTTLCQRMISTWCTAHTKQEPPDDDEQVMLKFPFLFYISLRNAGSESSIEEMIRTQLLQDPAQENLLSTLLHKESANCLIILDGLDEWTPPKHHLQKSPVINAGLPSRNVMNKITIVTTSRPWKLEVLRLKTSEIDQHIELVGLDDASSEELIRSVIAILNTKQEFTRPSFVCNSIKLNEFMQLLEDKNLEHFRTIPIILKMLICLWHDGKPLGESQCTIYSGMINLLFELAEKRRAQSEDTSKMKEEWKGVKKTLPKCFEEATKCQEFGHLISSLGRLASETIFNPKQESTLVFESSQAGLHGMSKTEIEFCLKIGILTQNKVIKGCTSQMKSFSFLHKTFQEFLAAVFVSMSSDPSHKVVDTLRQICNSADKVFEMSKVFVFISGMNPEIVLKLSEHIWEVVSPITHKYRQCIENRCNPMNDPMNGDEYLKDINIYMYMDSKKDYLRSTVSNIFQLMVDCTNEGLHNGIRSPVVKLEDIFIENDLDDPKLQRCFREVLMPTNIRNIKSVDLLMFEGMQSELCKILNQISSLQKLTIFGNVSASADTIFSLLLKSKETLFTLQLCSAHTMNIFDMSKLPAEDFSNMIPTVNNLKSLCFCNVRLNHNQLDSLMAHLTQAVGLIQLYIFDLLCTDCGRDCRCPLDLSNHQQLEDLSLDLQGRTLLNTSQLRHCKLYKLKGMAPLLKCLQGAPNLQAVQINQLVYGLNRFHYTEEIEALAECLLTLENVRTISLFRIDFGETELKLSPRMKNLEQVIFHNVRMSFETLRRFVDSIPCTEHLVKVAIHNLQITPQEKTETARKYIKSCPMFVVSQMSYEFKLYDNRELMSELVIHFQTKGADKLQSIRQLIPLIERQCST